MLSGEKTWNFNLIQNNDIYLYISKNKKYKETEMIKKITINNFVTEKAPKKGSLVIYRPTSDEKVVYENLEEYIIKD